MSDRWRRAWDKWPQALATIAAVAVVALVVIRIAGTHEPLSIGEAEEAIKDVSYPIKIKETPDHVLLGEVRGSHGVVHFAAADSLRASGIPARLRRIDPEPEGGGNFWVWDDSVLEPDDGATISVDLIEALCRKETGEACPI